jgi:hypothetical protein
MTPPTTQDAGGDAWANAQVQSAITVLLPEINSDWFEDHSAEHREWLARAVRRRMDNALSYRDRAHRCRRDGLIGQSKDWIHDAIREVKAAKHYAKELKL